MNPMTRNRWTDRQTYSHRKVRQHHESEWIGKSGCVQRHPEQWRLPEPGESLHGGSGRGLYQLHAGSVFRRPLFAGLRSQRCGGGMSQGGVPRPAHRQGTWLWLRCGLQEYPDFYSRLERAGAAGAELRQVSAVQRWLRLRGGNRSEGPAHRSGGDHRDADQR